MRPSPSVADGSYRAGTESGIAAVTEPCDPGEAR